MSSTSPHLRPWGLIPVGLQAVQVDQDAGVAALVSARKGHQGSRIAAAAVSNLDLRAGKVELGLVLLHGHVQRNMLDSEQVLAAGGAGGDGRGRGGVGV